MRRYIKVAGFFTDDQIARFFAFFSRDQGARESDELAHPNVVNLLGLLHEEMCYARVLSGIFWILASQEVMHVMGFDQDGGRNMLKNAMDNHKSIHHLSVIRRAVTQALICEYVIVNDRGAHKTVKGFREWLEQGAAVYPKLAVSNEVIITTHAPALFLFRGGVRDKHASAGPVPCTRVCSYAYTSWR